MSPQRPPRASTSLGWTRFYHNLQAVVSQYYNPAGQSVPGGATQALKSAEQAWTNAHTSTFALQHAGTTPLGAGFDGEHHAARVIEGVEWRFGLGERTSNVALHRHPWVEEKTFRAPN